MPSTLRLPLYDRRDDTVSDSPLLALPRKTAPAKVRFVQVTILLPQTDMTDRAGTVSVFHNVATRDRIVYIYSFEGPC